MITKQRLQELKSQQPDRLYAFLKTNRDQRELLFVLENLGHLPAFFDGDILLPFVRHPSAGVRFWAVKNLGKLESPKYFDVFVEIAQTDSDSMVRREAVSSIGRMRLSQSQPILIKMLSDNDPKVVLQAIRGLLVFKDTPSVRAELLKLITHPNEMVQSVIRQEFSNGRTTSPTSLPHPISPSFLQDTVVQGDVREILKLVPDESVHLTFTSPPYYNARDYSIYISYNAYLDFLMEVFRQVHRVTKEGRFLIVNTSPVIIPRVSRAHSSKRYPIPFDLHARLVQSGWEFIDDIIWLKPESSVKNRNAGFLQHRKPLAYKPNAVTEYLMVYRKETDKLLDWNMNQYDWDTIEASRVRDEYETTNVWRIDPSFDRVHSAVFPLELCNRVIRYYPYKGDLVFDPFAGSGTLGRAARNLARRFFLTEQEGKYIERMKMDLGNLLLENQAGVRFLTLAEFASLAQGRQS